MFLVITPAYKENEEVILQNILSIQIQMTQYSIYQYIIFDGVETDKNFLKKLSKFKNLFVYKTRKNHNDFGDYVRRIATRIALKNKFKAISFLDADNYLEKNHFEKLIKFQKSNRKNIIISSRKIFNQHNVLVTTSENLLFEENKAHELKYFDTNMITLFNEKTKCGLLWGKYPREMSIIGDRIISKFLINNFKNDIAFNNSKSIIYYQNKISKLKVKTFKDWYNKNYYLVKDKFFKNFGFDLNV